MPKREAYLFYEAGQAVAAAHLGLPIRHVSGNPVKTATDIVLPRNQPKARMILWLTGMAAEKRGAGSADPLRRTRTRARIRASIESIAAGMKGDAHERLHAAKSLVNQAQDRANAICSNLYDAIDAVAGRLREAEILEGSAVVEIVRKEKARRAAKGKDTAEEPGDPEQTAAKPREPHKKGSRQERGTSRPAR